MQSLRILPCNLSISSLPQNTRVEKKKKQLPEKRMVFSVSAAQTGMIPMQQQIDPSPSSSPTTPVHTVTVHHRQKGITHQFQVPQDQYILHTAEGQDISLPFACRHGCCTSCAVRVKSGEIRQPAALGISADLKKQGYALLCVSFPCSDLEVETQNEDEVYWLQFGRYFARGPIDRDDYALELAMGDE